MKLQLQLKSKTFKNIPIRKNKEKFYKEASVFLLIFYQDNIPYILSILKSDNKGYLWKNQIALPGGILDPDDKNSLEAAYREVKEEINISKKDINFISSIGYYKTINQIDIQAFIGFWKQESRLIYDKKEIAKIIKIPIYDLIDTHKKNNFEERELDIFELIYPYKKFEVWGVTARIFYVFLNAVIRTASFT
ncbi:MAG: NUDIX domain-containing protein [Deltaproteobacteria bacterium]|nr:NUDIX domain-containing protein [Deltaproteobacteria bacterium]